MTTLTFSLANRQNDRIMMDRQLACLKGYLRVVPEIPQTFRHGLFHQNNTGRLLPLLIRLAGDHQREDDSAVEERGMSIKVRRCDPAVLSSQSTRAQYLPSALS